MLRPDIAFAVHRLSLSFAKPTEEAEEQLRSLMKYIAGTQTYTISLQIPRRWERAKNLELLAFSTSWVQDSRAATCVSLSFMGVHLGASIQQATTKAAAEYNTVRLASTLAFHTKSLLQEMMLEKTLCFRVLTRGPVPQKLGLSKQTRHIDLWSQLGQFQLSKVQPKQDLAEQLANNLRACDLHRLLPKLQLQARPAGELALPTVQGKSRAFVSSSLGSFYIGQLCCATAMEKPQLVQKLSGKEFVDHLAIPELESMKLLQQQLSSGGANTALHNELRQNGLQKDSLQAAYSEKELERTASPMSFQQLSLQQSSLQAAYSIGSFQTHSLTVTSLSFQDQLTAAYLEDALERTALENELAWLKRRQRSSSSLPRTSFQIILVILMIAAFLSKSIFKSFRDRELEENEELQTFPLDWALELVKPPVLLTIFGDQQLEEFETKNLQSCKEKETVEPIALPNLLWEQELEKLLVDQSCPLDLLHDHLGQEHLWTNQLRQNPLENEKNKKLDENKELEEKNFQSLILEKLVALMPEKHFALAASSRLLGNEAWEEQREASEISFDNVGDKELLQEELRRAQLGCKDLWPASFRALCPNSSEENSVTEETFANTSLGKETFKESSLTTSSFTSRSLTESSFTESSLAENSFSENTFLKNSFSQNSFDKKSFAKNSFDEKSFDKKSFDKKSFDKKSFDKSSFGKSSLGDSSLEETSLAQSSLHHSSLKESSLKETSFEESSLAESSLATSTSALSSFLYSRFQENSFEESSFNKSSFNQSSFEDSSFGQSSLEESSLKGRLQKQLEESSFEQSSLEPNSFDHSFGNSSFRSNSLQDRSLTDSSFQDSSFRHRSFQEQSFQDKSFQDSSLQDRSFNSRTFPTELYQLERRTSATELKQLERPAFSTELETACQTKLETLRAQQLRRGSFSLLRGSSLDTIWTRGRVLRGKLPLFPSLTLSSLSFTDFVAQAELRLSFPEKEACTQA